jgi:hypothetical protein
MPMRDAAATIAGASAALVQHGHAFGAPEVINGVP